MASESLELPSLALMEYWIANSCWQCFRSIRKEPGGREHLMKYSGSLLTALFEVMASGRQRRTVNERLVVLLTGLGLEPAVVLKQLNHVVIYQGLICFLVDLGLNSNQLLNNGETVLTSLAQHCLPSRLARLAINAGAQPGVTNAVGLTALHSLVVGIGLLDAKPSPRRPYRYSGLPVRPDELQEDVVRMADVLCEHARDVNARIDGVGLTPFALLCKVILAQVTESYALEHVGKTLLDHGADIGDLSADTLFAAKLNTPGLHGELARRFSVSVRGDGYVRTPHQTETKSRGGAEYCRPEVLDALFPGTNPEAEIAPTAYTLLEAAIFLDSKFLAGCLRTRDHTQKDVREALLLHSAVCVLAVRANVSSSHNDPFRRTLADLKKQCQSIERPGEDLSLRLRHVAQRAFGKALDMTIESEHGRHFVDDNVVMEMLGQKMHEALSMSEFECLMSTVYSVTQDTDYPPLRESDSNDMLTVQRQRPVDILRGIDVHALLILQRYIPGHSLHIWYAAAILRALGHLEEAVRSCATCGEAPESVLYVIYQVLSGLFSVTRKVQYYNREHLFSSTVVGSLAPCVLRVTEGLYSQGRFVDTTPFWQWLRACVEVQSCPEDRQHTWRFAVDLFLAIACHYSRCDIVSEQMTTGAQFFADYGPRSSGMRDTMVTVLLYFVPSIFNPGQAGLINHLLSLPIAQVDKVALPSLLAAAASCLLHNGVRLPKIHTNILKVLINSHQRFDDLFEVMVAHDKSIQDDAERAMDLLKYAVKCGAASPLRSLVQAGAAKHFNGNPSKGRRPDCQLSCITAPHCPGDADADPAFVLLDTAVSVGRADVLSALLSAGVVCRCPNLLVRATKEKGTESLSILLNAVDWSDDTKQHALSVAMALHLLGTLKNRQDYSSRETMVANAAAEKIAGELFQLAQTFTSVRDDRSLSVVVASHAIHEARDGAEFNQLCNWTLQLGTSSSGDLRAVHIHALLVLLRVLPQSGICRDYLLTICNLLWNPDIPGRVEKTWRGATFNSPRIPADLPKIWTGLGGVAEVTDDDLPGLLECCAIIGLRIQLLCDHPQTQIPLRPCAFLIKTFDVLAALLHRGVYTDTRPVFYLLEHSLHPSSACFILQLAAKLMIVMETCHKNAELSSQLGRAMGVFAKRSNDADTDLGSTIMHHLLVGKFSLGSSVGDDDEQTDILWAAVMSLMEQMLTAGADVNKTGGCGRTVADVLLNSGHCRVVGMDLRPEHLQEAFELFNSYGLHWDGYFGQARTLQERTMSKCPDTSLHSLMAPSILPLFCLAARAGASLDKGYWAGLPRRIVHLIEIHRAPQ